jgi:hypothetical protein
MSDRVYLLNHGSILFAGVPGELDEDAVVRGYLGHVLGDRAVAAAS